MTCNQIKFDHLTCISHLDMQTTAKISANFIASTPQDQSHLVQLEQRIELGAQGCLAPSLQLLQLVGGWCLLPALAWTLIG